METIDGFSGAILVTRGGATVVRASAGVADAETDTACTTDTRFQIASVSKQFTAASVMLLAEEGKVGLHDPIARWLTDCPHRWRTLTLHQLLSHTSGLGHWRELPGFDVDHPGDAHSFLERFAEVPLRTAPGSTWHYSSPGYLLAALIVERVTGQRYADFLTEQVLGPLGMTSTCVGETPLELAARGYRDGRRVDVPEFAAMPGTGDLWSTVGELARYTAAFNAGDLLTAFSREAMVAPHASMAGAWGTDGPALADSYGYGYALGTLAGHTMRFHIGDNPGYQSFLGWLPAHDTTVVILSNNEEPGLDDVLRRLEPVLLEAVGEPCEASTPAPDANQGPHAPEET
ncbi:serine hydrolase domain-containing protein [Streptomyces sp. NPDC059445]|uniref:serine hydrolase domain-containing protein n=1 Tax=Streptomyces sp. NPDC059445 TaxID=3346832 RepID=UPI0036CD6A3F